MGIAAATGLRRARSAPPALSLVASLATAAIAFGAAVLLEGSGFLAVYVAGLTLGGMTLEDRPALLAFHEGLASVADIGLFLALGLLVFPSQLGDVAGKGVLLALIITLIARPIAVRVATMFSDLSRSELAQKSHLWGQPRLVWTVVRLYLAGSSRSKRGMGASRKSNWPRGDCT